MPIVSMNTIFDVEKIFIYKRRINENLTVIVIDIVSDRGSVEFSLHLKDPEKFKFEIDESLKGGEPCSN